MVDLIGPQSWLLFDNLSRTHEEIQKWLFSSDMSQETSYQKFAMFCENVLPVNDVSERYIKDVQDFIKSSTNEDQRQNIFLVVKQHRKNLTKACTKRELKYA